MDIAEDRGRFSDSLKDLGIPYPNYGTAYTTDEAIEVAKEVDETKLLTDGFKLVKAMHDIFVCQYRGLF